MTSHEVPPRFKPRAAGSMPLAAPARDRVALSSLVAGAPIGSFLAWLLAGRVAMAGDAAVAPVEESEWVSAVASYREKLSRHDFDSWLRHGSSERASGPSRWTVVGSDVASAEGGRLTGERESEARDQGGGAEEEDSRVKKE